MFRIWFERDMPEYVWPLIDGHAEPIGPGTATPHDLLEAIGPADAVIASSLITYDASVLDRAPRLRVIARTGIGYDKVDVAAATERGVAVCNAPNGPTVSTAEHTMALLLSVAKRIPTAQAALREGGRDFFASHQGTEIAGLRLGLVGMGRIGSAVARMAAGFGMAVIAYDPFIGDVALADLGIARAGSVDEILETSDVVSLHLPLTDDTRHLLNEERIGRMKRGAILINTARGGLVDHDALLRAIDSGGLAGAGLDTTEPEPLPPGHPLLDQRGVVVTPHVAAATDAAKVRLYESAVEQALQVLNGEMPPHLVNREVWPVPYQDPDDKETTL